MDPVLCCRSGGSIILATWFEVLNACTPALFILEDLPWNLTCMVSRGIFPISYGCIKHACLLLEPVFVVMLPHFVRKYYTTYDVKTEF